MKEIIPELLEKMQDTVRETVSDNKIGVAFSGGVDSSLMAKLCIDLGYHVTLLTIGFENSHDILFSKQVNEFLKLPHQIMQIEESSFVKISSSIKNKIRTSNISWNENCIAFYYVSQLAKNFKITTVVTANGIDELFCGYNAYREAIREGENKIHQLMVLKLENEVKMMEAVNLITSEFGVRVVQPFLSKEFIKFAKKIPLSMKIKSPDDLIRKHAIRILGSQLGLPEISLNKPKKALQYGSLIHKAFIKSK
jgi:asparagine synthase (glutamine-hydrolysing)